MNRLISVMMNLPALAIRLRRDVVKCIFRVYHDADNIYLRFVSSAKLTSSFISIRLEDRTSDGGGIHPLCRGGETKPTSARSRRREHAARERWGFNARSWDFYSVAA